VARRTGRGHGGPSNGGLPVRMRAAAPYAQGPMHLGTFPACFEADRGAGVVCAIVIIESGVDEFRDVPSTELGNPALDDVSARFLVTHGCAFADGSIGGGHPDFDYCVVRDGNQEFSMRGCSASAVTPVRTPSCQELYNSSASGLARPSVLVAVGAARLSAGARQPVRDHGVGVRGVHGVVLGSMRILYII
jgi:hypothetical protein